MKKSYVPAIIVMILAVFGFFAFATYNSLVQSREDVDLNYGQVQTTLQRRSDLIPNLVSTVKGYALHEETVFTEIADARSKLSGAIDSGDIADIESANNELSSALGRLLAIQESYPNLKADSQFTALMDELAGTENRINVARQNYNDSVRDYNTKVKTFPTNLLAGVFGFSEAEYFQADESAQQAPVVDFGSNS